MLTILDHVPAGLLESSARDLHRILPGPTLVHLPGRRPEPVVVTALLHGNEDAGLRALQQVLKKHAGRMLPRALSFFIGNVSAAAAGLRVLPGQPDYNRVWPGAETSGLPEHDLMQAVMDEVAPRRPFASVDIHNNTGTNPHYACVRSLDEACLHLALLFSRIVVFFNRPLGVACGAFSRCCPAVTVECGKPGSPEGAGHAAELVDAVLHLDHFPVHPVPRQDIDVYHTVGIVKVPPDVSITFGAGDADIRFPPDIDHVNFRDLPAGTLLAETRATARLPLDVWAVDGTQANAQWLEQEGVALRLRRPATPAMLTLDEAIVRQDCLCYLMERMTLPAH